jgi:hypothetical protein
MIPSRYEGASGQRNQRKLPPRFQKDEPKLQNDQRPSQKPQQQRPKQQQRQQQHPEQKHKSADREVDKRETERRSVVLGTEDDQIFDSKLDFLKPTVSDSKVIEFHFLNNAETSPSLFYILPTDDEAQKVILEIADLAEQMEDYFRKLPRPSNGTELIKTLTIGANLAVNIMDDVSRYINLLKWRIFGFIQSKCLC